MEYRQQLKSWQAVVAVMVILGIVGYQCARRIQTVDAAARFAIGVSLTAGAQNPNPGMGTAEPYTPPPNAKDLKAVLFHWMWGTGMLKGHDERDMVASLEYQGKLHSSGRATLYVDKVSHQQQIKRRRSQPKRRRRGGSVSAIARNPKSGRSHTNVENTPKPFL